jgi:hypothetical protein
MFLSICSFQGLYVSATVTNLGLDAGDAKVSEDGIVAFRVRESEQGNGDLNGDGDSGDDVLHLHDPATDATLNLGLVSSRFYSINVEVIVFDVDETAQGNSDLNGDGDSNDQVLHVHDLSTGTTTNLGLAGSLVKVDLDRIAFVVLEDQQGSTDLNGDSDTTDEVLHLYDSSADTTVNLGLATPTGIVEPVAWIEDDFVAFAVFEDRQGGADLNGDGDGTDRIMYTYDFGSDTITNTGLALTQANTCCSYEVGRGLVFFDVLEDGQSADFNGDGDTLDEVAHILEFATGDITNIGIAIDYKLWWSGRWFKMQASEESNGNTDFNNDGDATDMVTHVYDLDTGSLINTGLAARGGSSADVLHLIVDEQNQGNTDLNGDGDADDWVLHLVELPSLSMTNLGLCWSPIIGGSSVEDNIYAVAANENDCGNTDLNGDGDSSDGVAHVVDLTTGSVVNLGLAVSMLSVLDDVVTLFVSEASQDNTDLNGDGDTSDNILQVYNPDTDTTTSTGLVSYFAIPQYGVVVLGAQEADGNADLNGDGDSLDRVLHTYDVSTGTTTNSGLAFDRLSTNYLGIVAFGVYESDHGSTDLNGDGDSLDYVIHILELEKPGETPGGTENPPPGQGGTPPGQGGTPPGLPDPPPGQGGDNPGQDGCAPDCAPGQKKKNG